MTLERQPEGTQVYFPPKFDPLQQDLQRLSAPPAIVPPNAEGPGQSRFRLLGTYEEKDTRRKVYHWQVEYFDTRGGLNHQQGRLEQDHNKLGDSNLDTRWEDHLILNQLTTEQTTVDDATGFFNIFSVNAFNRLVIATSKINAVPSDGLLFGETSSTNPAIMALTYDPGTDKAITMLANVTIDGVNYLAVGKDLAAVELLSNANDTPTSAGSMHANTQNCSGMIVNPFGDVVFVSNGAVWVLPNGSAFSDSPTLVRSINWAGGWCMGMLGLGGGPVRIWWNFAQSSYRFPGVSLEASGDYSNYKGKVFSTDFSGDDPRELVLPLKSVVHSVIVRDGIVASDGERLIFHNGRVIRDLRMFADRPANSNRIFRIAGLYVKDSDLYVEVNEIASPSGSGNTRRWVEYYDWAWNAWHKVTTEKTVAGTGIQSYATGGSLPVSAQTGFLHERAVAGTNGSWWRVFQAPPGVNPYSLRFTTGAAAGTGVEFESTGTVTWTSHELPGLAGWPKTLSRLMFMGDIAAGGTAATIVFKLGDIDSHSEHSSSYEEVTLDSYDPHRAQMVQLQNNSLFYRLGVQETLTRDSSNTRWTPKGTPFILEGFAFVDQPQDIPAFIEDPRG